MSNVPSAKTVLLADLDKCKKGDSIRITGIWKKYDENSNIAVIYYGDHEAEVDISNSQQQCIPSKGDIVQCLGEVVEEATFGILRISARIIKSSNTIDLELYEKVVKLRNNII